MVGGAGFEAFEGEAGALGLGAGAVGGAGEGAEGGLLAELVGGAVFEEVFGFEFFFAGEGAVQGGGFVGYRGGRPGGLEIGDRGYGFEFSSAP